MGMNDTKLYHSIVQGHDLLQITAHIDKIVDINFQCKGRPTALHAAVVHNNAEVAALLLERGADMMMTPLKKCLHNVSDCILLKAFKQDESHEAMQFVLLRHLSNCNADEFDSAALKKIARVAQHAMLYCSKRVFFAAQELNSKMTVVNPTACSPLIFTIIHVGLYEENMDNTVKVLDRVLEILDTDSTMLWYRYLCPVIAKMGAMPPSMGSTGLGTLLFFVLKDRQKRCTEYGEYLAGVERMKSRIEQYMPATDPHHDGFVQSAIECNAKQKCFHDKNVAMMSYLANDFAPRLFATMLASMRVALGMSTHHRLGNQKGWGVGQLHGDSMNMIFNELVRGIATSPEEYKCML